MFGKPHKIEQRIHLGLDLGLVHANQFERESGVVEHRTRTQQVEVLKDHADVAARSAQFGFRHGVEAFAVDGDRAFARTVKEVDAAHKRGFACPGAADNAEDFALFNVQRNVFESVKNSAFGSGIALRDVL